MLRAGIKIVKVAGVHRHVGEPVGGIVSEAIGPKNRGLLESQSNSHPVCVRVGPVRKAYSGVASRRVIAVFPQPTCLSANISHGVNHGIRSGGGSAAEKALTNS